MRDKRRSLNRWMILIFASLAFISGIKFNSVFLKPARPVETIDIIKYEADFRNVHKLISQNTLAVYGIADSITNSWINSLALKQDAFRQVEKIFSELENSGAKAALTKNNDKIEEGMKRLKKFPFKYLALYAPKAMERPRVGTQLALAETTVPGSPAITANRPHENKHLYQYNGQKIKVYYREDQVTGLSN
ncbi:MAG: hypothetical protein NTY14_04045 [Candidatus Omnitrophica bacterium]|nr:hypothetical protein [Candidatus Omnitrophota bacterium]